MSQHDFDIANQTASNARADINSALQALASTSSGSTEPATKYANQLWYDTTNNILKIRNEANSAWLNVGYVDQTNGFRVLDDTQVVNTSGTQTGLLGGQSTATWQAGTGTLESLVSAANVKAGALAAIASGTVGSSGYITVLGMRFLWDSFTSNTDDAQSVTFATAFPTACLGVIYAGTDADLSDTASVVGFSAITTTGFKANRSDAVAETPTIKYLAFGY